SWSKSKPSWPLDSRRPGSRKRFGASRSKGLRLEGIPRGTQPLLSWLFVFQRTRLTTHELDALPHGARAASAQPGPPAALHTANAQYLGKSARITELMKGLANLPVEEKKARGAAINQAKQAIEAALTERRQALADAELAIQLQAEALDVTLPGR